MTANGASLGSARICLVSVKPVHLRHFDITQNALDLIHRVLCPQPCLISQGLQLLPGFPPVVAIMGHGEAVQGLTNLHSTTDESSANKTHFDFNSARSSYLRRHRRPCEADIVQNFFHIEDGPSVHLPKHRDGGHGALLFSRTMAGGVLIADQENRIMRSTATKKSSQAAVVFGDDEVWVSPEFHFPAHPFPL